MPVEDIAEIDLGTDEKTFDELDKAAAKAIVTLEKRNKELEKSKKLLQETVGKDKTTPTNEHDTFPIKDTPKEKKDKEDTIDKKKDKDTPIEKKEKDKISFREALADQAGGGKGANLLFSFGKNPIGTTKGILRGLPFLGGIVVAGEFAKAVIDEIEKLDEFFKKFIGERIDDRVNQLITIIQQARIRSGDIQEILTTQAGGIGVRVQYNTFNEFNKDQINFENDHNIRNVVDT